MSGKAAQTFEELHVYQRARELTNAVYAVTRDGAFARDRGLVDQVRRAAVSIVSNIAEGFERGSSVEFIQYLYIVKGSCGEVRAQLQIACDQGYVSDNQRVELEDAARRVSGMLSNFVAHLQGSSYPGEKVRRPQRQAVEAHQRRLENLRAAQPANMRKKPDPPPGEVQNPGT